MSAYAAKVIIGVEEFVDSPLDGNYYGVQTSGKIAVMEVEVGNSPGSLIGTFFFRDGHIGYLMGSFNITTSGNYTLAFAVANRGDTLNSSGLLVDAITQAAGPAGGAVPLPAGMYLMLPGLLMAGLYVRKLRRCAAR